MARRKKAIEPDFAEIPLGSAVVRSDERDLAPVEWWSQAEAEMELGVTDRTLRNWADIGLPVRKGAHGRPIYPADDCRLWVECWRDITRDCQRYKREAPKRLSLVLVLNWRQLRLATDGVTEPWPRWLEDVQWDWFVVVPLDCESQGRARMLRLAAEGTAADEEWHSQEDLEFLKARGVRLGYQPLDLGWPEVPPELRRESAA